MLKTISHPDELIWIEGDLPDIRTVDKNCAALVWLVQAIPEKDFKIFKINNSGCDPKKTNGTLMTLEVLRPWEDELNSLRWDGRSLGNWLKVKYYAWIIPPKDIRYHHGY